MTDKVKVICASNGRCVINSRELNIRRIWRGRGDVVIFSKEDIEKLMYDAAFSNMIREGYLYIEDMDIKKEIGVEPEDAETPTIILLDDKTLDRFWRLMPFAQFKIETKSLTKAQITMLAKYAILHGEDGNIEKANYLSDISGYQILKGIELEKQSKEV
ncbi:MAG: hypothetical protein IIW92_05135 [Lachnospiraceae bacterium]|nr:hypothetical protein [Lachnospiraceae bacterium]